MKIELDYVKAGDYYLPDLTLEPRPDRSLEKYGLMPLRYLKEHRPIVWAGLVIAIIRKDLISVTVLPWTPTIDKFPESIYTFQWDSV